MPAVEDLKAKVFMGNEGYLEWKAKIPKPTGYSVLLL